MIEAFLSLLPNPFFQIEVAAVAIAAGLTAISIRIALKG